MKEEEYYIVMAVREHTKTRVYLLNDGELSCEAYYTDEKGIHVTPSEHKDKIWQCRHFAPSERKLAEAVASATSEQQPEFRRDLKFKAWLIVPDKVYAEWPEDYKGVWTRKDVEMGNGTPESYIGKRQLMVGADHDYAGCHLLTEGAHFEII